MAEREVRVDMIYVAEIRDGDTDDAERYRDRGHRWSDDELAHDACRWCGLIRARAVGGAWRYQRPSGGRWFLEVPWCAG